MGKLSNGSLGTGSSFIQQSTLEKLKCTLCKKYLSILPVYRSPIGDAICGRCPIDLTLNFSRDDLYEHVIEFQKFPCANRESGCLDILFPIQLAEHEQICPYNKHDCPTKVYNNCIWKGSLSDLVDHFEKKHPTFMLKECKFEVDFVNNHSENCLMPYGECLYIVTREGNSTDKTYAIVVKYLGSNSDIKKYMYVLTLESGNKAYSYSLEQSIGTRLELQGQIISQMLHDPLTIVANISIKEGGNQTNTSVSIDMAAEAEDDDDLDYEQLKEVECPVCMEHMVPPIYQCEVGHSICKICKESQNVCPTCRASFKKTQNFALERIIMYMIYPCKHPGCKYKTKAKNIRQHETSCLFGPFSCPLRDYENCSEIFPISELFNHIKNLHYESLLELDTISVPFDGSVEEDIIEGYILKHVQLFKLCFMYNVERKTFSWAVQLVGPPEESAKYSYELEIIDNSGKNMRMYLKTNCTPLADKNETFQNLENYVYLHLDQICKFIKNQLTYRILIAKND